MKIRNHTALKEWSSVIAALARGEQVLLIRKGGIADSNFGLEATSFYLFPTNFHEGGASPAATVPITHWCEAVHTWQIRDLVTLYRLEPLVMFDRATLEQRYRFGSDQAVNVIAVRTFELPRPIHVRMDEQYAGCRSWVSLDEEIDTKGPRQAPSDTGRGARIQPA